MKARIIYLITFFLGLNGCSVPKNANQTNNGNSTINLDCQRHNIPANYFSGKVIDKKTREGIPFAKIVLRSYGKSEEFGVITDNDGKFTIKNMPLGVYHLTVNSVEYAEVSIEVDLKEYSNCVAEITLYDPPLRTEKPVIYLYPTQKQIIHVKLNYAGSLTHTYPKYQEGGWKVTAETNGTLWDENGQEYYALFWEGNPDYQIVPEDGFVVSGKETAAFLEEKLAYLGLNRREANEFIMYWLPRMENNPFNFIHFSGKQYEEQATLEVNPQPETIIRVMMITQPLQSRISVPLQDISALKKNRKGFTLVEWGGSVFDAIIEKI